MQAEIIDFIVLLYMFWMLKKKWTLMFSSKLVGKEIGIAANSNFSLLN